MTPELSFDAGRYEEVSRTFRNSPPPDAAGWVLWGRALLREGRVTEAAETLATGLDCHQDHDDLLYYCAMARVRQERWNEADALLTRACDAGDTERRAFAARARLRLHRGMFSQAFADFSLLERSGRLPAEHRLSLAACLARMARWMPALNLLDDWFRSGGRGEAAWYLKARCLEGLSRIDEAAAALRDAVEAYPESELLSRMYWRMARRIPHLAPTAILAAESGREVVLNAWTAAQRRDPANLAWAHRIAVLATWSARRHQARGKLKLAEPLWRTAFAQWTLLLENPNWIRAFTAKRFRIYHSGGPSPDDVAPPDFDGTTLGLSDLIEPLLNESRAAETVSGRPSFRDELHREGTACHALREALSDGLGIGDGETTLVMGPVSAVSIGMVDRLHEGIRGAVGEIENDWRTWSDPEFPPSAQRSLRWLFSSAGYAVSRLMNRDAAGALRALRWTLCPDCSMRRRGSVRAGRVRPETCGSDCREFAASNPGLSDLAAAGADELQAAVNAVRLHALVLLAEESLVSEGGEGPRGVGELLAAGSSLAGERCRALYDEFAEKTLERARSLTAGNGHARAVAVLDGACLLFQSANVGDDLISRHGDALSEALCNLGAELGTDGRLEPAVEALRRAVEIRPHLFLARRNLAICLNQLGDAARKERQFEAAGEWHRSASEVCAEDPDRSAEAEEIGAWAAIEWGRCLRDQAIVDYEADRVLTAGRRIARILEFSPSPTRDEAPHEAWQTLKSECAGLLGALLQHAGPGAADRDGEWERLCALGARFEIV